MRGRVLPAIGRRDDDGERHREEAGACLERRVPVDVLHEEGQEEERREHPKGNGERHGVTGREGGDPKEAERHHRVVGSEFPQENLDDTCCQGRDY